MLIRMSSSVSFTSTPRATDNPTAGSASMARIFLSGNFSARSLTIQAQIDVFPTPPLPATVMILALFSIIFPPVRSDMIQHDSRMRSLRRTLPPAAALMHDVRQNSHRRKPWERILTHYLSIVRILTHGHKICKMNTTKIPICCFFVQFAKFCIPYRQAGFECMKKSRSGRSMPVGVGILDNSPL